MKRLGVPALLLASVALTSCLGHGNEATTHLRGVNLVTDSPTLEFTVDGVDVSSADYGDLTPLTPAHPGTHELGVAGIIASDLITAPQIEYEPFGTPQSQTLADGTDYTIIAYGTVEDPKLLVSADTDLSNGVPDNTVVYKIINAAPNGPPVNVLLTAPEAGITTPTKIGTLSFGQSTPEAELMIALPAGILDTNATLSVTVTIELTNALTGEVVIPANSLVINEQQRLLFVIADNIGPGSTPIAIDTLVSATGAAASGIQFANPSDDAELAFSNVAAGTPPYNVIGGLNLQQTLATNIGFGQKSSYSPVNSGVAGTIAAPTSDPSHLSFLVSFSSAPDQSYTEYAVGPLNMVEGVVLLDDRRTVPTQAEFRILNAAYSLQFGPSVDIYLTPDNMGLNILATNGNRPPPNYANIAFKTATAYVDVVPGAYDVYFANTGTSDIILGPIPIGVKAGTITTYVFTNTENGTLELLPFNDGR